MSAVVGTDMADLSVRRFPVTLPLSEIVKGLNDLQPHGIFSYASTLRMLAEEALSGRLYIRPRSLVSGGEPLSDEDAAVVEQAFDAILFDAYGASETGMIAVSDGSTPGLYLNDDLLVAEPVDAGGRPVAPGARSSGLFVTPLHHFSLPLLRYELTDEVTMLADPCPHGSSFRRIARVEGRRDDCFRYAGGLLVHPIVFRSPLTHCPAITAYQVRQSERGARLSVIATSRVDCDALARGIERVLAGVGLVDPQVRVRQVTEIERTEHGGKLRRFVPLEPSWERPGT
jgi:phenylacetate-coenzyme A ligase PaaK-like adenylate-forming protein